MAGVFRTALDALAANLTAAGAPASVDEASVNVPGVWVELAEVQPNYLGGNGDLAVNLYLCAPDSTSGAVVDAWDALYAAVSGVIDPIGNLTPVGLQLPADMVVPALRMSVTIPYTAV